MSTISLDHRVGITPIVLRRAVYYLNLGLGEYTPEHPHYDCVKVEPLYDLTQNPTNPNEWAAGTTVSFFRKSRRVRWIEFSNRVVGAGGDDILTEVNP